MRRTLKRSTSWRELALQAAILTALSVWMTWPVAAHLHDRIIGAGTGTVALVYPDVYLTVWIVSWVARMLIADPAHLFDADIFHPADHALAYSEHMLGVLPITLPAYWASGNPIFTHQLLLLGSFVLCGLSMAALVRYWTGSAAAGLVAACLYTFARYRMASMVNVHVLVTFYFPLVLLFSSRYLRAGRRADLVLSGAALLAQALCAYSIAYPLYAAVLPFWVTHALLAGGTRRRLLALFAAGACTVAVMTWLSLDLLAVQRLGVTDISAAHNPAVMLLTSGSGLREWLDPRSLIFPGAMAYVLGLAGIVFALRGDRVAGGRGLIVSLAAFALPLIVLGMGPHGNMAEGLLAWLWRTVPGLEHYRVARRFTFHAALPLAVAGGFAAAVVEQRVRAVRGPLLAWVCTALLVAAVCWDLRLPLVTVTARDLPPVYAWLLDHAPDRRAPLLEVPAGTFGPSGVRFADAQYTFWNTYHRFPLVNGYSGYGPPGYGFVLDLVRQLPSPAALATLQRLTGARWLIVHLDLLSAVERARWGSDGASPEAKRFGDDLLFALPEADADWRPYYRRPIADRTMSGLALDLAEKTHGAQVQLQALGAVAAGSAVAVTVTVRNTGPQQWPTLAFDPQRRVGLDLWWEDAASGMLVPPETPLAIPRDLAPNEAIDVTTVLAAPPEPGRYRLVAQLSVFGQPPLSGGEWRSRVPVQVD